MNTISVDNIKGGWLTFRLQEKEFEVSYLTDFKANLDKMLIDRKDDIPIRLHFDGEGEDLYLTSWVHFNILVVVWEEYSSDAHISTMVFNYSAMERNWLELWDKIKDNYYELGNVWNLALYEI